MPPLNAPPEDEARGAISRRRIRTQTAPHGRGRPPTATIETVVFDPAEPPLPPQAARALLDLLIKAAQHDR